MQIQTPVDGEPLTSLCLRSPIYLANERGRELVKAALTFAALTPPPAAFSPFFSAPSFLCVGEGVGEGV